LTFPQEKKKKEEKENVGAAASNVISFLCRFLSNARPCRNEMIRIMREGRLYLGEGGIDVASILKHMPPMVYSIELPNLAVVREKGYAEHAFRCLETTRAYVEAQVAGRYLTGCIS